MGLSPSDFWQMAPQEFWWWVKAKKPDIFSSQDQWDDLYELMKNGRH